MLTIAGTPVNSPTTPTTATTLVVTLSAFPALASVGGLARVDGGKGTPVALVRMSATAFTAFSMTCPHQGTTVQISGGAFVCPNHGARFSSAGVWTGGQKTTNLSTFATVYDSAKGTVTVTVAGSTGTGGRSDDNLRMPDGG
jgi:Rieske Fe-S protein